MVTAKRAGVLRRSAGLPGRLWILGEIVTRSSEVFLFDLREGDCQHRTRLHNIALKANSNGR